MRAILLAILGPVVMFACGTTDESAPTGSAPTTEAGAADQRVPDVTATTAADGGGVCCPLDNPCSPNFHGGWAPTAEECVFVNGYDGKFDLLTDEHGCPYWKSNLGGKDKCCGCVIPPDASPDADADTDAGPDADAG